ncbi:MAG: methylated-DNA--[protein]-cysteine S-methyltransferase [Burkholderiaceae bacterium]
MLHANDRVWTATTTRLGSITLAATARGLAGVWFEDQRHYPTGALGRREDHHPTLLRAQQQLQEYLDGTRSRFTLPLDLDSGTPFQQAVWQALLQIPMASTRSYAAIGGQLGKPTAARAIGAAVGRNPLSIVVPCHRVVGSNGALTGYAGGLDRKAQLLALEARMATRHPASAIAQPPGAAIRRTIAA